LAASISVRGVGTSTVFILFGLEHYNNITITLQYLND
jgi:hypothetical protein